jgi:hypothetical protein
MFDFQKRQVISLLHCKEGEDDDAQGAAYSRQKMACARTGHDAGAVDFLLKGKLFNAMQIRWLRTAGTLSQPL